MVPLRSAPLRSGIVERCDAADGRLEMRGRFEMLNCNHRLRKSKNRLVEKRKCRLIIKVSKEVLV